MSKRTSGQAKSKSPDREQESFRGQSAFRNRGRETGLDPFDMYTEQARSQGVFLRQLVTGRLRTRNGIALLLMFLGGLGCLLPFGATLVELGTGASPSVISQDTLGDIIWVSTIIGVGATVAGAVFGILLLMSVARSLARPGSSTHSR